VAVAWVLGAVAVILILVSVAFQLVKFVGGHDEALGLVALTNVGSERNFPALYSSLNLAFASLCCAVVAAMTRKSRMPDVSRWVVLAAGFLYLAFDEALSLHERMSLPIQNLIGKGTLGFRHSFWTIPAFIGLVALALFFLGFLRRLPGRTRLLVVLAGVVYVGGAMGVEYLSGNYAEAHGEKLGYNMIVTVEETLEMSGVILFIYAILDYLARTFGEVRFRLGEGSARGMQV
jgi:hypothetical protein